jgi:regulator of sirC expression with transglutaminase-like and TPR domain
MHPQSSDPFYTLVQQARNGRSFALDQGALLIACQAYPKLDIAHYLRQLDFLAEDFRAHCAPAPELATELANLSHYLFADQEFRGNQDHYDDPRNSYLNDVLDRRLGIPLTLSVVYLELGRRLHLPLAGVNFPYHFLVRSTQPGEALFIDPYAGGTFVDNSELGDRLPVIEGRKLELTANFLAPTPPQEILTRMLRNLKRLHLGARKFSAAVHCAERITWLQPTEADNYRDLGFLYYWIHDYNKAIGAFNTYLRWANDPPDAKEIQQNILVISGRLSMLN